MSVATELRSPAKSHSETRAILGPTGNRVRVSEEAKRKKEGLKRPQKPSRLVSEATRSIVQNNSSLDSTSSLESSSGGSSVKMVSSKRRLKPNGSNSVKVVPDGVDLVSLSLLVSSPVKRCDWITPNSGKRDIFRKLFDNFDLSSVAKFTEKKLLSLRSNGSTLLSEPKLRAIVDNANQTRKIQQEFGSFSNYCWSFVNHKPIRNGFCYARQVPVKTPKAELISKDLMQRGFRCVGPSVVYSFMQVAGLTNDHLVTCFRYHECNNDVKKDLKPKNEDTEVPANTLENKCSAHD